MKIKFHSNHEYSYSAYLYPFKSKRHTYILLSQIVVSMGMGVQEEAKGR